MVNEFEDSEEQPPKEAGFSKTFEDTTEPQTDDIMASGSNSITFDWKNAKKKSKFAARTDLNGKTVEIVSADIEIPGVDLPWSTTRDKTKKVKYCTLKITYDNGQGENFSGVRIFERIEKGKSLYSQPSWTKDRQNQASELLGYYADFKKKDINSVDPNTELMSFLNSHPKVLIKSVEVENPKTREKLKKNLIGSFIN